MPDPMKLALSGHPQRAMRAAQSANRGIARSTRKAGRTGGMGPSVGISDGPTVGAPPERMRPGAGPVVAKPAVMPRPTPPIMAPRGKPAPTEGAAGVPDTSEVKASWATPRPKTFSNRPGIKPYNPALNPFELKAKAQAQSGNGLVSPDGKLKSAQASAIPASVAGMAKLPKAKKVK